MITAARVFVDRHAGTVIITLLVLMGTALMLSLNVGGIVFGLGCWVMAYIVGLLQRAVSALEDVTSIQVQTIRNARERAVSEYEDSPPAAVAGD